MISAVDRTREGGEIGMVRACERKFVGASEEVLEVGLVGI